MLGMLSPPSTNQLSSYGRAYVAVVIVLGFSVVSLSVWQLSVHPIGYQWYFLAALTLLSGSATVKLPSVPASISVSETFVFTAFLLYGPAAGTLIVALDGLVISYWIAKRRREPVRVLFNMAAPSVSAWCAAHAFFWVAGVRPLVEEATSLNSILPALILSAAIYFSLNSGLITLAISAETKLPPISIWRGNFVWLSLNYFCGASVAALLVIYRREIDIPYVGLIVPLLLVLYFTFKTSMDRVEDANKHVEKINLLYLSTVETLAMAIDAKDQITHGHIRRVQKYAMGLAHSLGIKEESLLKAIESAALLHDMGKLAIPEHILNKPGKLTDVEFDKMKQHAKVGADILSAIDFPYPVVPIVRHHHENWNGMGYPSGLKGTDIPIGARILSVVDCFDALTSDRPYRPRLSDDEALRILIDRRGSMYDPLVVDTFLRVYRDISPTDKPQETMAAESLSPNAQHMRLLPELGRPQPSASVAEGSLLPGDAFAVNANSSDGKEWIGRDLEALVRFDQCVLFLRDLETDELVEDYSAGELTGLVEGMRIVLGQKLSGWVGANRQTVVNADPILDLGDDGLTAAPRLRSALSVPLVAANELIGVLTIYSRETQAFTDEHRRAIETYARQITIGLKLPASALTQDIGKSTAVSDYKQEPSRRRA